MQDAHRLPIHNKQNAVNRVASAEQKFPQFNPQLSRLVRQTATIQVRFEGVDAGHQSPEPTASGDDRVMFVKPS